MESKDSLDILHSIENGMLKIILNRPEKKNAINISMYKKLLKILHESIADDNIYVVVITGAGKFFSSGNDFSFSPIHENDDFNVEGLVNIFKDFVDTLITYPKLLIAVVNGPAIGIAVTMLPLFDLVYASDKAYFHTPFTRLGLVAEGCSTYTFPKIFGKSKGGDMLYLGYKMNSLEAKNYGFISEVYKNERLDEVWIYLRKLSEFSPESVLAIKRLVKQWDESVLLKVNAEESDQLIKRLESPDCMKRLMNLMFQRSKI